MTGTIPPTTLPVRAPTYRFCNLTNHCRRTSHHHHAIFVFIIAFLTAPIRLSQRPVTV
ncbi:hypothetical protein M378DRAFT_168640 [Amanita muscaria Koide BX008]|uniref:Uncharacterized protein n=1 Tax=Amanita muscaria (strain Koide BX008) TaxID=946122 RepID=A0A0C2WTF5_AMAMK|nr:hypothetical protein M378DRAFT_168640 [Amanita muscaria Koide BX008]